jgi:hypothetical protein
MTRSALEVCMSLSPGHHLPMLWPGRLQTVMMKFPFCDLHTVVFWFCVIVMWSLFCDLGFRVATPPLRLRVLPTFPAGWWPWLVPSLVVWLILT